MKKTINLRQDLGVRYIREFFVGACFRIDDTVYTLVSADEETVTVNGVCLSDNDPSWFSERLPISVLRGFETFKYPTLGYRQLHMNGENVVFYVSTTRSAMRGLRPELLRYTLPFVYTYAGYNNTLTDELSQPVLLKTLFAPKFTDFGTGIGLMLSGKSAGFAVSEDLAVVISCNNSINRYYDVCFRERVVGHVNDSGVVHLYNKVVERDSIKKLLMTRS